MEENIENKPESELTKRERRHLRRLMPEEERKVAGQSGRALRVFGIVLLLAVALFGVVSFAKGVKQTPITGVLTTKEISPLDQVKGNKTASTTLIEYSDFQCPACATYFPVVNEINKTYGKDLAIVYRHFSLAQHKNAVPAAQAAEAAGKQGKFWEMHDILFTRQVDWDNLPDPADTFAKYAEELSLDMASFKRDINDPVLLKRINDDRASGLAARVQRTPTFFLNGQALTISNDVDLKNAVAEALGR
jgi:protein-disulfide isomerase